MFTPNMDKITKQLLPGTNCGKCGFKTCWDFARILMKGRLDENRCPYISGKAKSLLAEIIKEAKKELESRLLELKKFSPKKGMCQHSFDKLIEVRTSCGYVDGYIIRCTLCGKDLCGSFSHEHDDYFFPGAHYDVEWCESREGWLARFVDTYLIRKTEEPWDSDKMQRLVPPAKRFSDPD